MKLKLQQVLDEALRIAQKNEQGSIADYIPELASVPKETLAVSVRTLDGHHYIAGDKLENRVTLQSASKLIVLIGLLEEFGPQKVFAWTRVEPSGDDFNSVARLDQFGPLPSNPMLNAGAMTLCSHIPGNSEEQLAWLEHWAEKLFSTRLHIDPKVLASERRTGDRNRSLAYLLKANNIIKTDVDLVLDTYFCLCSFKTYVDEASYLPMLLANYGVNLSGKRVISHETVKDTLAVMATCGLYNESGTHLVRTGMPAKSGVSGYILASAVGRAGVAVYSPRVNQKGTSVRGEMILEYLSQSLSWHFASPLPVKEQVADYVES